MSFWEIKALDYIILSYITTVFISLPALMIYTKFYMNHISEGFIEGMTQTMNSYSTRINDKRVMDELQLSYQCCGAKGYRDWFHVVWVKEEKLSDKIDWMSSVPFSCCQSDILDICRNIDIKDKFESTLNTEGCAEKFSGFVTRSLCTAQWLWALVLVIHLISLILFSYWKTSIRRALLKGNPEEDGTGWISIPYKVSDREEEDRIPLIERLKRSPKKDEDYYDYELITGEESPKRMDSKLSQTFSNVLDDIPDISIPQHLEPFPPLPSRAPRFAFFKCDNCNEVMSEEEFHSHTHSMVLMASTQDKNKKQQKSKISRQKSSIDKRFESIVKIDDKLDSKKVNTTNTTEEESFDYPKRKYRERYFILKEIR